MTLIRIATLLLVSLTAFGCWHPPTTFHVVMDPALAPATQQASLDAATAWHEAVGSTFIFTVGACPHSQPSGMVCVRPVESLPHGVYCTTAYTEGLPGQASAIIYVAEPTIPDGYLDTALLHEFGHAQGLVHHNGHVTMNPVLQDESPTITDDDRDQWYSIH